MGRTKAVTSTVLVTVLALACAITAVPSSAAADDLTHACVNSRSGTIHIVGATSPCEHNKKRVVLVRGDQVVDLQRAVKTLEAGS